jgi:hypothetical protein
MKANLPNKKTRGLATSGLDSYSSTLRNRSEYRKPINQGVNRRNVLKLIEKTRVKPDEQPAGGEI